MKILIVDDEKGIVIFFKHILEKSGYSVLTAGNGLEASDILRKGEKLDLIVLDIMMPKMDGYSFFSAMKQEKLIEETPVLILTAKPNVKELFAMEKNVKDFFEKPFNSEMILKRINEILLEKKK